MLSTVFDTERFSIAHTTILAKLVPVSYLEQNSLMHITDGQWWYSEHAKFQVTHME